MGDAELEAFEPSGFEWDANKSQSNIRKHGIDFEDAVGIFYGPVVLRRSDRNNEARWVAIGSLENRLLAVVFTKRAETVRIISARRARTNEERVYRHAKMGRSSQGQD